MRILFLTFYYKPDMCAGSFRSEAFIKALKDELPSETSVDVITTMPNRYQSYQKDALTAERIGNIRIQRIKLPDHKGKFPDKIKIFAVYFFSVLNCIRNKKYDRIYATSSRLFTAFLGAFVARTKGADLYLDIRDIFTDTMKSLLPPWLWYCSAPVLFGIEKFTINTAYKVNLVSRGFEEHFKQISKNTQIVFSYFTNGIDNEFLNVCFKKKKQLPKRVITYAGNIGRGQALDRIIPGIARCIEDKFELQVVGDGSMRLILEKELKKNSVENVKIMDPVDRSELISIYRESDYLFLHLDNVSAFEKVLPSKIFEYAATGKPILAGVKGFAKYFLEEYVGNVMAFDPCSPDDFIKKIQVFNPVNKTRKEFIKHFSRKSIMNQMTKDLLK